MLLAIVLNRYINKAKGVIMEAANDTEILRKKLYYRSWHRGCKETDVILGYLADNYLPQFDEQQLQEYEEFLEEYDADIWKWITGELQIPERVSNSGIWQAVVMSSEQISSKLQGQKN